MPMSHKTVLVTGATAGLGRRLTERLADRGATLLLHGRDEERLAAQCRDLRAKGVEAHPLVADFSALSEVRDLAARLEARRATVDVLHGMIERHGMPEIDAEDRAHVVDYLAQAFPSRQRGRPNPFLR